jgi:ferredoxin
MKALVDADLCIGCELCVELCPLVFKMEEGLAVVIVDPVPADAQATCDKACDDCPVTAITIEP